MSRPRALGMVAKLIRLPRVPLVWVALCAGPLLGFAHEGPQHVVDEVTALITDEGETTERLVRRAQSYQRMGQLQAAQQDLARALVLSPRDRPAGVALVQVLLACDEPEQAQTLAESMLAVSAHGADAAFLYAAVGDACAQMDRLAEAADA
ncbi:MAG: hypothetical protein O3B24_09180, partial [Verrucomicrobia bacterium]|nr:hypothetical protein [Verrucomicrobiota bacterium]